MLIHQQSLVGQAAVISRVPLHGLTQNKMAARFAKRADECADAAAGGGGRGAGAGDNRIKHAFDMKVERRYFVRRERFAVYISEGDRERK